jgi:hypothetical protein
MTDVGPNLLFRILRGTDPNVFDFTSKAAQGIPCRDSNPEIRRLWDGLSFFATEAQARRARRRHPMLGSHIAAIRVSDVPNIRVERTLGAGHVTVWAAPADLLRAVVSITEE